MDIIHLVLFQTIKAIRNRNLMIQFLILPILLITIAGYLTSSSFSEPITSYQYYSIPVMLFMYVGYGVNSSFSFIDQNNRQGNLRLLLLPLNHRWIYLSHIISQTIVGTITITINLISIHILFNNQSFNYPLVLLTYVVIVFLSNAIGIMLALIIDEAIVIEEIFTVVQLVLCLMGGCFFSLESISNIPRFIAYLSPVKWILDVLNKHIYIGNGKELIICIVIIFLLAMSLIKICVRLFKPQKYV